MSVAHPRRNGGSECPALPRLAARRAYVERRARFFLRPGAELAPARAVLAGAARRACFPGDHVTKQWDSLGAAHAAPREPGRSLSGADRAEERAACAAAEQCVSPAVAGLISCADAVSLGATLHNRRIEMFRRPPAGDRSPAPIAGDVRTARPRPAPRGVAADRRSPSRAARGLPAPPGRAVPGGRRAASHASPR